MQYYPPTSLSSSTSPELNPPSPSPTTTPHHPTRLGPREVRQVPTGGLDGRIAAEGPVVAALGGERGPRTAHASWRRKGDEHGEVR